MNLSYHLAHSRRQFNAFRHKLHTRHKRAIVILSLIVIGLLLICNLPTSFNSVNNYHLQVRSIYSPYSLTDEESSASFHFQQEPQLQLDYHPIDPDRIVTLRKHYEDALTGITDHSSLYSPSQWKAFDIRDINLQDYLWSETNHQQHQLIQQHLQSLAQSTSSSDQFHYAILASLLHYQVPDSSASCSAPDSRYLLYSWFSEYSEVNTACMSTQQVNNDNKPGIRIQNKVSSVREIVEEMEKAEQRRQKKKLRKILPKQTIDALTDECQLSILLDLSRALVIAQASQRQLILLPPSSYWCNQMTLRNVSTASAAAIWMGCYYPQFFRRPSTCSWNVVKPLLQTYGYHDDPFYDVIPASSATSSISLKPALTPIVIYQSLQYCHLSETILDQLNTGLLSFLPQGATIGMDSPRLGKLNLFQFYTQFLLTPSLLLTNHLDIIQQRLFSMVNEQNNDPQQTATSLIGYHMRYRAPKDKIDIGAADETLLTDTAHTLLHEAANTGIHDIIIWLDGDRPKQFVSRLQHRLPHIRLYEISSTTYTSSSPSSISSSTHHKQEEAEEQEEATQPEENRLLIPATYLSSLAKLYLFVNSASSYIVSNLSPIGRLLAQLTSSPIHSHLSLPILDVDGDDWYQDCTQFSYHFYRAHTLDIPVQRQQQGINHIIYPTSYALPTTLLSPGSNTKAVVTIGPTTASTSSPRRVQLLMMLGVSDGELRAIGDMFSRNHCDEIHSAAASPLFPHLPLSQLLQKLFNSPQTVDEYVITRMEFSRILQQEVAKLLSISLSASSTASASEASPIIRIEFYPYNINRPFRDVLKADVSMIARFIDELSSFIPIDLRLLIATREPSSTVYAGTKTSLAQLPTGMPDAWKFFFIARVLHDQYTALIGELHSLHPSLYHAIDMDDLILYPAKHARSIATFLGRSANSACYRNLYSYFQLHSNKFTNLTAPSLPDWSMNEAAGVYDITWNLRYHGMFPRSIAYTDTLLRLSNHALPPVSFPPSTAVTTDTRFEKKANTLIRSDYKDVKLLLSSFGNNDELIVDDTIAVAYALDLLHPTSASQCSHSRFLVFDLFLRAWPCLCQNHVASQQVNDQSLLLDDPPVAESIRAIGRSLSLALSSARCLIIPTVTDHPQYQAKLGFLQELSQLLQPLSACSLLDAGLKLACHCETQTWRLKSVEADESIKENDPSTFNTSIGIVDSVFTSTRTVVGYADDYYFHWLLHHHEYHSSASPLSASAYISAIHQYLYQTFIRHQHVFDHFSSYRDQLAESSSWMLASPTLGFSLPASDLYTTHMYTTMIRQQLQQYGFSQVYLTATPSRLYPHQNEDSGSGSRPLSREEQLEMINRINSGLTQQQRASLKIILSPRITSAEQPSPDQSKSSNSLLHILADIWMVAQCSHIFSTHASEEGMLIAELAYQHHLSLHGEKLKEQSNNQQQVIATKPELFVAPLYDLFGHSWLEGMLASSMQHLLSYVANMTVTRSNLENDPMMIAAPLNAAIVTVLPAPAPPLVYPPSVKKTFFSDSIRFAFIAGIEGAGHHFFESIFGGSLVYSPWNPYGRANVTRVKFVENGIPQYEDLMPNDVDVMGDGGKIDGEERSASASPGMISSPHFVLDLPLTRLVYELFVHDSVDAYVLSRSFLIDTIRKFVAAYEEPPQLPPGVPYHPKRSPAVFPLNFLGAAFGMHSYPNMFNADKMMHHPYLPTLANVMEEAGADFRVLLTVRSPQACHWSTVRRHHGEEVGVHASYMFQARGLHDNLAFLDGDIRALDPAFVLHLHLTDVTRDPYRYAAKIANHLGLEHHIIQSSLLHLSHHFAVQPDGAWRGALNSSQLIAMKDHFDFAPLLSIFKHRYDALKMTQGQIRDHVCIAPHTLQKVGRYHPAQSSPQQKQIPRQQQQQQQQQQQLRHVTLVSLEGSGDGLLRFIVEQLTGYFTGSVHGESTPASKSDSIPKVLHSTIGAWSASKSTLLTTQRWCAFHCYHDTSGVTSKTLTPPILDYQPVQWATRLAPMNQYHRDIQQQLETARRDRERLKIIAEMEGPEAIIKYTLRDPKRLLLAIPTEASWHQSTNKTSENSSVESIATASSSSRSSFGRYAGDDSPTNDVIILYRHPIDILINLVSLTISNHHIYTEPSRVSLNPIWSRWWKNGITKQTAALLTSIMQPVAHQYADFLKQFPYQQYQPQFLNQQRVLYVRYEDLILHPITVIPQLLKFLHLTEEVSQERIDCVLEQLVALTTGVQVSVCTIHHHNNHTILNHQCGIATDSLEHMDMDSLSRGHSRGLRHLTGVIEQSSALYPFKWLDLIEIPVFQGFIQELTRDVVNRSINTNSHDHHHQQQQQQQQQQQPSSSHNSDSTGMTTSATLQTINQLGYYDLLLDIQDYVLKPALIKTA